MILINKIFMLMTITFYYVCSACNIQIQSLYNLEFYFLLFCQGYTTERSSSIFNLLGKMFFTLSKWRIELRFMQLNPLLWKNTKIAKGRCFFLYLFVCFKCFSKKISIINSHHLFLVSSHVFNSSVAFDANFLRSFLFIPSKILRRLSLLFFARNVAM